MQAAMQPGNYSGTIEKVTYSDGGDKAPYFTCWFTITDYFQNDVWTAVEPARRPVFIPVTDKSMPFVKHKLAQIGVTGEPQFETDPSTGEDLLILPSGASDSSVPLTCTANGDKDKFEFTNYSPGAKSAKPASQNAKMVLKALWK